MATRKRDRVIALVGAITFLVTSSALVIALAVQNWQDKKTTKTDQTSQTVTPTKKEDGKLQGTKLANFTPVNQVDALQITDPTPGTGEAVKAGDTVTVDYTGAVAATGVIFQSSLDSGQTATFPLNQVIPGWTQGIPGMKVGGVRRLVIPASLAYGANPPAGSGIPANADLVFDVTLHKIGN